MTRDEEILAAWERRFSPQIAPVKSLSNGMLDPAILRSVREAAPSAKDGVVVRGGRVSDARSGGNVNTDRLRSKKKARKGGC